MLFSQFAGPVFGPEDIPKLILVILVVIAPFVLGAVALVFAIRDMAKKKLHRSTVIIAICAVAVFLFGHFVLGRVL